MSKNPLSSYRYEILYFLLLLIVPTGFVILLNRFSSLSPILLCLLSILFQWGLTIAAFFLLFRSWHKSEREAHEKMLEAQMSVQLSELQKKQEQFNAFQSQINPHFLYNTLDVIRGLALESNATDVSDAVGLLSAMFRYTMDFDNTLIDLSSELAQIDRYLKIQSLRFPGRFTYELITDCSPQELTEIKLPKCTIQPLIENAISHGLKQKREGGIIKVRIVKTDQHCLIMVSDNGVGLEENMVASLNHAFQMNTSPDEVERVSHSGIALNNIDARIKFYYGMEYGLHISSTYGLGMDIEIKLPLME